MNISIEILIKKYINKIKLIKTYKNFKENFKK